MQKDFDAWVPNYSLTPEFKKLNEKNAREIDDAKSNAKRLREQQIFLSK